MKSDFENLPGKAKENCEAGYLVWIVIQPHKRRGFDNTPSNLGRLFC